MAYEHNTRTRRQINASRKLKRTIEYLFWFEAELFPTNCEGDIRHGGHATAVNR